MAVLISSSCAFAQEQFSEESINKGRSIFDQNCAPCHGAHMADPQGSFDLRTFPPAQRNRFFNSVSNGKNSMPPWGGLFNTEQIGYLWAYVMAGEKKQ